MYVEADTLQIPQEGWKGVILDEMSIQQSIDIVRSRDNLLLVGFRDMGDETNSIKTIKEKKHQQTPSSHVFQLLYLPFLWVNKPVSVIYRVGRPITCLHVDKYPLSNKIYARICQQYCTDRYKAVPYQFFKILPDRETKLTKYHKALLEI